MSPGTEFARDFCAGIGPLQLGGVLVFLIFNFQASKWNLYCRDLSKLCDNSVRSHRGKHCPCRWHLNTVCLTCSRLLVKLLTGICVKKHYTLLVVSEPEAYGLSPDIYTYKTCLFVHVFHQKTQGHEILSLSLIWVNLIHDEARFSKFWFLRGGPHMVQC